MNRQLLINLLLVLSINTLISQNRFGVFGGVSNSVITDGFMEKINVHADVLGLHIGVLYEYKISEKIMFRPKFVYSQQGDRKRTTSNFIDNDDIDYKLDYLNIPLNFKFFQKPYVIAGPQLGYLISTKKMSTDFGDVENKFDVGFNLGLGYDFNKFFIEFNFFQGLSTLVEIERVRSQSIAIDGKNAVIQLSLGYYFN